MDKNVKNGERIPKMENSKKGERNLKMRRKHQKWGDSEPQNSGSKLKK